MGEPQVVTSAEPLWFLGTLQRIALDGSRSDGRLGVYEGLMHTEPARWPWLQPPADGPRVPPERIQEVEERLGIVRHGPPPPV